MLIQCRRFGCYIAEYRFRELFGIYRVTFHSLLVYILRDSERETSVKEIIMLIQCRLVWYFY